MNKNELEAHRVTLSAQRFHNLMILLGRLVSVAGWVGSVYLIMTGLASLVTATPEALKALAEVVDKLHVSQMLGWIVGALSAGGWVYERKGKQRAIKKLSNARRTIEEDDPYSASSELDELGQTPNRS